MLSPRVSNVPHMLEAQHACCSRKMPEQCQCCAPQKKELMLSQLRAELCIGDERHDELRQCVSAGEDRPWLRHALMQYPSPTPACTDGEKLVYACLLKPTDHCKLASGSTGIARRT